MSDQRFRTLTFYQAPCRLTVIDGAHGPEPAAVPITLTLPVEFSTDNGNDVVRLPNGMLSVLP